MKGKTWGISRGISTIPYQAKPTPTEDPNLHPTHKHVVSPKDKVEPIGSHSIPKHLPKVVSQHVLIEKSKLLRVQYANPQVLQNGGLKLGWCRVDERLIWALLSYSCTKWLIEGSDIVILEELYLYSHIHNHTVQFHGRSKCYVLG